MRQIFRFLRRMSTAPEVVSNQDLYNKCRNFSITHRHENLLLGNHAVHEISRAHINHQKRYMSVFEELSNNPELEMILRARAERVQAFLGKSLPLVFPELLSILCGLSHMNIQTSPSPAGSIFGNTYTQSDLLRQLGSRFFDLHCSNSLVFANSTYLSCNAEELEESMALLRNKRHLISEIMISSNLSECVIPYRGVHSAGRITNRSPGFKKRIRASTCVASFYTLLGILIRKFGSETVVREFWNPKMLHPTQGLLYIALKGKG